MTTPLSHPHPNEFDARVQLKRLIKQLDHVGDQEWDNAVDNIVSFISDHTKNCEAFFKSFPTGLTLNLEELRKQEMRAVAVVAIANLTVDAIVRSRLQLHTEKVKDALVKVINTEGTKSMANRSAAFFIYRQLTCCAADHNLFATEDVRDALVKVINTGDVPAMRAAAYAMKAAADTIVKLTDSAANHNLFATENVRDALVKVINTGDPRAMKAALFTIAKLMGSGDCFALFHTNKVIDALAKVINTGDAPARRGAFTIIGRLIMASGDNAGLFYTKEVIDALVKVINTGDPRAMKAAAFTIAKLMDSAANHKLFATEEVRDALVKVLKESDATARRAAEFTIDRLIASGDNAELFFRQKVIDGLMGASTDCTIIAYDIISKYGSEDSDLPEIIDSLRKKDNSKSKRKGSPLTTEHKAPSKKRKLANDGSIVWDNFFRVYPAAKLDDKELMRFCPRKT